MGTLFKIVLYADDEQQAARAAAAAFARVAELDGIMSDYRPTSELMRLCDKAGTGPVKVSDELFFVLTRAEEVSRLSDGAFDVTVGPVVHLWRLARRTQRLPDAEKLAQARALVGCARSSSTPGSGRSNCSNRGCDSIWGASPRATPPTRPRQSLKKHGVTRALVAAGGDLTVSDAPPGETGWDVTIQPLDDEEAKKPRHLLLANAAVSTSGDAKQYVEIDGKRYSHIVDPKTGLGLVGRMSVTVVAPDGITADSLTKVVWVLGPDKGFASGREDSRASAAAWSASTPTARCVLSTSPRFPRE